MANVLVHTTGKFYGDDIRIKLVYNSMDPYAVVAVFYCPDEVPWEFSRDLLLEIVNAPKSGLGDVVLERKDEQYVTFNLENGTDALVQVDVPFPVVAAFASQMLQIVPAGAESKNMNLDEELEKALARWAS